VERWNSETEEALTQRSKGAKLQREKEFLYREAEKERWRAWI
jgi:hypothetical protein